jgi:hypothetical protein
MRANLDDPLIHIRPICSRRRGSKDKNPMGPVLLSTPIIAPTNLDRHQILRNFCHESGRKGLRITPGGASRPLYRALRAASMRHVAVSDFDIGGSAGFPVGPCTVLEMDFQVTVCHHRPHGRSERARAPPSPHRHRRPASQGDFRPILRPSSRASWRAAAIDRRLDRRARQFEK